MTAFHVGIACGTAVFLVTVSAVFVLMWKGGSFARMGEEANAHGKYGAAGLQEVLDTRTSTVLRGPASRPQLHEHLLLAATVLPRGAPVDIDDMLADETKHRGLYVEIARSCSKREEAAAVDRRPEMHQASNGSAQFGVKTYDPDEFVWNFLPVGPFDSSEAFARSALFDTTAGDPTTLTVCVLDAKTRRAIGGLTLCENAPAALRVRIAHVWFHPAYRGCGHGEQSPEGGDKDAKRDKGKGGRWCAEALYLVLNRLFTQGYRRVEWLVDAEDIRGKRCAERLGFTTEGVLRKHSIVKEANCDAVLLSMLNSDWAAAGKRLQKRLHGKRAAGRHSKSLESQGSAVKRNNDGAKSKKSKKKDKHN
jgi:RimJ/RimL family protein N-acetyltransferase